jgi:macrolide transport system ATP-binding/permease protein
MIRDLHYAFRTLIANKGFTLAAAATLALGIGANTAVFSVVNAVLIQRLPVTNPDELVMFYWLRMPEPTVAAYAGYGRPGPNGQGIRTSFSYLTFERIRDRSSTLANVFAISSARDMSVTADDLTDGASGDFVSGGFFDTLGITTARGRALTDDDDRAGADPVVVISHRYWQRRFHEDPAIVGKMIAINRVPMTIVGVTPPGFEGIRASESTDVTIPMSFAARLSGGRPRPVSTWWVQMMGRLKPGVSRSQALADVQRLFIESVQESWAARPPSTISKGTSTPQLQIMDGSRGPDQPRLDLWPILAAMFGGASIVLLIGCVNVANLVVARTSTRKQEIAIRLALGATRHRVIREMLTESLLLASLGTFAGVLVAFWGKGFLEWMPGHGAPIVDPKIDRHALLFASGLSVLTAVLCGLGPAIRASRQELASNVTPRYQHRRGVIRRALVVAQVALSLALLAVAGQFVQTLHNLRRVDVGFEAANLLVFGVNPIAAQGDDQKAFRTLDEIRTGIERIPGVRSATMSVMPVLAQAEASASIGTEPGAAGRTTYTQGVGPRFFETLGIPLRAGRDLTEADREGAPRVVVINETLAQQMFPDGSPIGREVQFLEGAEKGVRLEVVGVVGNAAYARLQEANPPTLYMPHRQNAPRAMTFEVKTAVPPFVLVPAVQEVVRRIDGSLSLTRITSQERQIEDTIALPITFARVIGLVGSVALALACIGLYGIVSFDVVQRTREIGIRMALGAQRSNVVRSVLSETAMLVGIGVGLGWALAVAASVAARSALFGVAPGNPIAIVSATLVLVAAAALASLLPARRATRVDPTQALRQP